MLTAIASAIAGPLIDRLVSPFTDLFKSYLNKEISADQLRSEMVKAMLAAFAQVETAEADALAKTYASFMQAATQSLLLQVVWASVTISQLLVLLWHQVGIPALVYWTGEHYPSSGSTVEWAYALIAACLGLGPIALRTGPGAPNIAAWKSLIAK